MKVEAVIEILLTGDEWRRIEHGSLKLDDFELAEPGRLSPKTAGFKCKLLDDDRGDDHLAGPFSAIRGVRYLSED